MTDAATIAARLTKAQRDALKIAHQDHARHAPYHTFHNNAKNRAAWRSMIGIGLVTEEHTGYDLIYQRGKSIGLVGISPLGLEVRRLLMENTDG